MSTNQTAKIPLFLYAFFMGVIYFFYTIQNSVCILISKKADLPKRNVCLGYSVFLAVNAIGLAGIHTGKQKDHVDRHRHGKNGGKDNGRGIPPVSVPQRR